MLSWSSLAKDGSGGGGWAGAGAFPRVGDAAAAGKVGVGATGTCSSTWKVLLSVKRSARSSPERHTVRWRVAIPNRASTAVEGAAGSLPASGCTSDAFSVALAALALPESAGALSRCNCCSMKRCSDCTRRRRLASRLAFTSTSPSALLRCACPSSSPNAPASRFCLSARSRFVAWQAAPLAAKSMRNRKPSSQDRQNSLSGSATCLIMVSLRAGMKYRICHRGLAYELAMSFSRPA
mmetsp:Transcript_6704/g.19282  ORF Transcript_6704/g.19282 Transcript_6704/m.19282 type:complete len:237 (-) Transcript_6704:1231-1941(-)